MDDRARAALDYHLRTRHAPHAYARALGWMDWDTQPDPFRRYVGAPVELLDREIDGGPAYDDVMEGRLPSPDGEPVARLFRDSLAISAWKEAGDARWALRVNPSSGNLHPTEGWLVNGDGVFHYNPFLHGLERRAAMPGWGRLAGDLPPGAMLVGLTSIPWREAWKYGERAFRYCQHDLGHAIAGVTLAANALGWRARVLDGVPDAAIAALLGIDGSGPEGEVPECLIAVWPGGDFPIAQARHVRLPPPPTEWLGTANRLSGEHHEWPVIAEVEAATRKEAAPWFEEEPPRRPGDTSRAASFREIVHRRRSAVAMDGRTSIPREAFLRQMRRACRQPLPWAHTVDLAVFVHRVDGMEPGLYHLRRATGELAGVTTGDVRGLAGHVSCGQDIASDGAYAVAMIADLDALLERWGAPFWRRVHWEAGAIGQVLYLEAEADGVRATGIGCFFDDAAQQAARAGARRPIYHFTVGGPVEDERLRTGAPYEHVERL
ncbi:MAG: SagB/ThcOx family dehydrogenase [Myxococcota bacterium]